MPEEESSTPWQARGAQSFWEQPDVEKDRDAQTLLAVEGVKCSSYREFV